ncbi:signal peptidase I [Kitasatospora sp. NPDC057692]|uniref:signal peptidase I n=1 Tax=Kitasatospora sp. NPDC057692 TaxID=3346215 RepID=UPI00368085D7
MSIEESAGSAGSGEAGAGTAPADGPGAPGGAAGGAPAGATGPVGLAAPEAPGAGGKGAGGQGVGGQGAGDEGTGGAGGADGGDEADGGGEDGGGRKAAKAKKKRPLWQELPLLIVIALLLSLGIKTFFVQAFSIPSGSMQHTLEKNDRVLVDKFTPWFGAEPERGEVVVFKDPGGWLDEMPREKGNALVEGLRTVLGTVGLLPSDSEKDLIKRVIAVGGDTVECRQGSPLKVNGVALDEPYLFPGSTPCDDAPVGEVTVPKDHLWVMGDHRNDSRDSRFHVNEPGAGFVPVKNVIGRAFVIAWPLSRWDTLPVPDTFEQKGLASGGALQGGDRSVEPAGPAAPEAAAVAAAVPFVLWRRRRTERTARSERAQRSEHAEQA